MFNFEDINLVLIKPTNMRYFWIDTWNKSYPLSTLIAVDTKYNLTTWQDTIDKIILQINSNQYLFVVAHGLGCNAFVAWLYKSSINIHRRIKGSILVSPQYNNLWNKDPNSILNKVIFNFKSAIVISENDQDLPFSFINKIANNLSSKLIIAPFKGKLDCKDWEWGMKLMQDMIIN